MTESAKLLIAAATLAYGVVLLMTVLRLVDRREPQHRLNLTLILFGWLLQSIGLYFRGLDAGACPVRNAFEILQFVSWSAILLYIFTGQVFRLSLFGTACATLASLLSISAFVVPGTDRLPTFAGSRIDPWIEAHAATAFIAYGAFALLAALSALYLLQHRSLKTKRHPRIFRFFPSLFEMDEVLLRLLVLALGLYSCSLALGAVYWIQNPATLTSFKLGLTAVLWVAYALVLLLRLIHRLVATRLAFACIGLFLAALFILWPVEASRDHAPGIHEEAGSPLPPSNAP
jgi:ABC-type uncharacterized transport system permease subunit